MKKGKITHVFPGSNTPIGFYSFYKQGLKDMERVFVLKGGPGTGKSTLMRKIAYNMSERGYDIELWQCSSDNDSIDGTIIPALSIAIVDGTAPHVVDPVYPGAVDEIVNLGNHWNQELLRQHKDEIKELTQNISACFAEAYVCLKHSKEIYDMWCKENGSQLQPQEIELMADEIIGDIFHDELPKVRHFFASAITPAGWVGYNQELSAGCKRRYVLQANSAQNVHMVLDRIAQAALDKGHDLDMYHSAMEPEYLEMLVLPNLQIALVDGNAVGLEAGFGDVLVDLRKEEDAPENSNSKELEGQWQGLLEEAKLHIAGAKSLHNKLESYYIKAMDFEGIDQVAKDVFAKIWQMAADKEKIEQK